MSDQSIEDFRARILECKPLRIRGGGSKDFYGGELVGDLLDTRIHSGIVNYDPTELVITLKAGTTLKEAQLVLATRRQYLPFEPPMFGGEEVATIGGAIAAGLSGPRRASVGALRDFVLGMRVMDGVGRELKFGGEVMKNVAGYDVSRLMAGSMGTLGVILDVSLKVLPVPMTEATLRIAADQARALELMNQWGGEALPISATCWIDDVLSVRLSGAEPAVRAAQSRLGGVTVDEAQAQIFWKSLRDLQHNFFTCEETLWRLATPSITPELNWTNQALIEWGGAQRWFYSTADASEIHALAASVGAGATAFKNGNRSGHVFAPLAPAVLALHTRIKAQFDPHGIFGRGRLHPDL